MGFQDEEAFFAAVNDRVSILKKFFKEVYFLDREDESIVYTKDGHSRYFQFHPVEIPANEEEFVKIRDNVYDRGGDPNNIVMGIWQLFEDPDYDSVGSRDRSDKMLASYFVKS